MKRVLYGVAGVALLLLVASGGIGLYYALAPHAKSPEARPPNTENKAAGEDAHAGNTDEQAHGAETKDAHAKEAPAHGGEAKDGHAKEADAKDAPAHGAEVKDGHAKEADAKDAPAHGAEDGHAKEAAAKDPAIDEALAKHAQNTADQPYMLVRTLERMQDQIAQGDEQAHRHQRSFIAQISAKMLSASEAAWQEPRNARGAIIYVLSGCDPRVLTKLLTFKALPDVSPTLLKGVLAYSQGRNAEAVKLLTEIDDRAFETRTAGHLALAKAMAVAPEDAPKALRFLDDARLLCPGTLVEEAALRRQVLLLSNVKDYARFEMLSFQYLRRFAKSIYARNFYRSFAIATATSNYGSDPKLMRGLESRLDELSDDMRRQLYMALAEEGVIRGRVALTRLAADKIGYLLPDGSRDALRLQLYKAAALVVTSEYNFALARLRSIDRARLGASDAELLDSALAVASQVRIPPKFEGPIKDLPPLSSAAQVRHGAIAAKSEALDNARKALTEADALLNKDR
jgi:chemotaxis protein MotC